MRVVIGSTAGKQMRRDIIVNRFYCQAYKRYHGIHVLMWSLYFVARNRYEVKLVRSFKFSRSFPSCVGIQEHEAFDIETYHCPMCADKFGPLVCEL